MKLRSLVVASLLPLAIGSAISASAAEKPNILFLLSDDHSYPYLSCYGDPNVQTPTLDKLAAGGMKFHRFFTASPQCVPSRASLMTGRSPVAARMTRFSSPLPRDEITLPEILREQGGYYTGICGRTYHLDGSVPRDGTSDVAELFEKNNLKTFASRVDYLDVSKGEGVEKKVAEFLDKKPEARPYFLWVNYNNPHHPWNEMTARPDPAKLKLPPHWPDLPGVREQFADYCGEVNRLDLQVKIVLDTLEARGALKNTLIVFAGDNGAALPHGKGSLYDPGSNVPFIVNWAGAVKPGGDSRALLSGEDLAPTLLEAAGLKAPSRMSGLSFLPLLRGENFTPRQHVFVERGPHGSAPVSANMSSGGYDLSRAVRSERYKFIYNCTPWIPYAPVDSAGGAGWQQMKEANAAGKLAPGIVATYFTAPRPVYELYDLENDPSELKNLSGAPELAAIEKELRSALAGKMLLDFDYLPLPDLKVGPAPKADEPKNNDPKNNRAATFEKLDADRDGKLSKAEFGVNRQPADAEKWFVLRDVDKDGFISRDEYLPGLPLGAK